MSTQSLHSIHYEGDEYVLVESKPGLGFHPEQFGIVTEQLHTACLRGFVGTFAIRDGGLFLDSLEVLAQDGRYPEINGVPPACRGGPLRPALYFGLGRVPYTGTLRFGNDRDRTFHVALFGPSTWMSGSRPTALAPGNPTPHHEAQLPSRKNCVAKSSTWQRGGNELTQTSMNTTNHIRLWITLAGALALIAPPNSAHANPPQYSVTVLGGLGGMASYALGINDSGQVVGFASITGDSAWHAVLWTGTTPTDLGTLGGTSSYAASINDSGQVAGTSLTVGDGAFHAVLWTGTTPTDLGTLSGGKHSFGYGINESGQVAGNSDITINGAAHAVRWTGTVQEDLGTLPGTSSEGYSINDSGEIAGYSVFGDGHSHAVRWSQTTVTDLGTLGGTHSQGYGINDSGQVAGWSYTTGNDARHAVLWTGTTPKDLGTLAGNHSVAYGVNDSGDVTGVATTTASGDQDAFLYTDGVMYGLSTLLVPGSGVTELLISNQGNSINNLDQIAAYGTINGQIHALLLTPMTVPEPSSALLLLGSGWILLLKRRRGLTVEWS